MNKKIVAGLSILLCIILILVFSLKFQNKNVTKKTFSQNNITRIIYNSDKDYDIYEKNLEHLIIELNEFGINFDKSLLDEHNNYVDIRYGNFNKNFMFGKNKIIVLHSEAKLKYDETLAKAVAMNLSIGTKNIAEIENAINTQTALLEEQRIAAEAEAQRIANTPAPSTQWQGSSSSNNNYTNNGNNTYVTPAPQQPAATLDPCGWDNMNPPDSCFAGNPNDGGPGGGIANPQDIWRP